jgi:acyl-CoA synthetase (AMP-forming)/AMP-acid ligase II
VAGGGLGHRGVDRVELEGVLLALHPGAPSPRQRSCRDSHANNVRASTSTGSQGRDGTWSAFSWLCRHPRLQHGKRPCLRPREDEGSADQTLLSQPEAFCAFLGTIAAGAVPCALSTTSSGEVWRDLLASTGAHAVFCHDALHLLACIDLARTQDHIKVSCLVQVRWPSAWADWGGAQAVVLTVGALPSTIRAPETLVVCTWEDFLALGEPIDSLLVEARAAGQGPGNCACLSLTSGVSGVPQLVMHSHDNVTWTTGRIASLFGHWSHLERIMSYLPISHCLGQVGGCSRRRLSDSD